MNLSADFGAHLTYIINKKEYEHYFDSGMSDYGRCKKYCERIIPEKYERIEALLSEYLDFPE